MLKLSMIILKNPVDDSHIIMETSFTGSIGNMMHIQEGVLSFMQNDQPCIF